MLFISRRPREKTGTKTPWVGRVKEAREINMYERKKRNPVLFSLSRWNASSCKNLFLVSLR